MLSVKINNQKLVIGILSTDSAPQVSFDLVFEKEFELSHNGKTSVHFCGYKAAMDEDRYPSSRHNYLIFMLENFDFSIACFCFP